MALTPKKYSPKDHYSHDYGNLSIKIKNDPITKLSAYRDVMVNNFGLFHELLSKQLNGHPNQPASVVSSPYGIREEVDLSSYDFYDVIFAKVLTMVHAPVGVNYLSEGQNLRTILDMLLVAYKMSARTEILDALESIILDNFTKYIEMMSHYKNVLEIADHCGLYRLQLKVIVSMQIRSIPIEWNKLSESTIRNVIPVIYSNFSVPNDVMHSELYTMVCSVMSPSQTTSVSACMELEYKSKDLFKRIKTATIKEIESKLDSLIEEPPKTDQEHQ